MFVKECGAVVIGRNEGERLRRCLNSLVKKVNNVVYVDSGSTDDSVQLAEALGIDVVRLNLVGPFSAARARNEGFATLMARWPYLKYVQFVDGDCELVEGWLDTAIDFISRRDDVAVVCGRRRERHPEDSIYNRLCDIEWDTPVGESVACGGDSVILVAALVEADGFRPGLIAGEEPELCIRLRERGWKIWRLNAEMTGHDAAMMRFRQWWVRAVRSGYGFAEVTRLHKKSSIYKRETIRALFWGGVMPIGIMASASICPAMVLAALVYPFQICRIACIRRPTQHESWTYAGLLMISKFAECQGILKYFWNSWRNKASQPIEYKHARD